LLAYFKALQYLVQILMKQMQDRSNYDLQKLHNYLINQKFFVQLSKTMRGDRIMKLYQ